VNAPCPPRFSELQLVLEPARGELVRAFVREAALAEGVPQPVKREVPIPLRWASSAE